ncbi:MAG: phospholipid carrier-dependent glycosyltransferase [Chloroflexota bacterium]
MTAAPRAALGGIVLLALVLRLWGLAWQLPFQFHPDEAHYTWKAMADMIGGETLDPRYFRNPSLFTYFLYGQYRALGFQPPKLDERAAVDDGLFRPPSGVAFLGRLNSALLGALTVLLVGLVGGAGLGWTAGLTSAAFLAVAFIHVRDSHYATNDVPAVFLLVGSVGAGLGALRAAPGRWLLAAGALGGAATSTKYNAGLFVVPVGVVVLRLLWQHRSRELVGYAALAGVIAAAAFLAGTPFSIITPRKFLDDFRTQARFCGDPWEGQVGAAPITLYAASLGEGLGLLVVALAIWGAVDLLRRDRWVAVVLLAVPVAYLGYMSRCELFFVRFALPAVPFLCLLAGRGVVCASRVLADRVPGSLTAVALCLFAVAPSAYQVALHNSLVTREDTRVQAARWLSENVPTGAKVLIEEYTIRDFKPRAYGGTSWQLDTDLFKVTDVRPGEIDSALRGQAQFFVSSSFQYERFSSVGPRPAEQRAFYEALARQGALVASFSPGRDGASLPFEIEDLYTPFWRLDQYERPGPTVRIYRLR